MRRCEGFLPGQDSLAYFFLRGAESEKRDGMAAGGEREGGPQPDLEAASTGMAGGCSVGLRTGGAGEGEGGREGGGGQGGRLNS